MAISLEELQNLLNEDSSVEKVSTLSSDGKNLLTRIPKEIRDFLNLSRGDKIRWKIVDEEVNVEFVKSREEKDASKKKARN